jgi:hypothetical protein
MLNVSPIHEKEFREDSSQEADPPYRLPFARTYTTHQDQLKHFEEDEISEER